MDTALLRAAMRAALPGAGVAAIVTAGVILPSFTLVLGVITLFLLFSFYPIFLIGAYIVVGWHVAARLAAAATAPRWRAALIVGLGVTLTLTLALLIMSALGAVSLAGFLAIGLSLDDRHRTAAKVFGTGRDFLKIGLGFIWRYLAGAILIGLPCAWLGAWLGLRPQHRRDEVPGFDDTADDAAVDRQTETRMPAPDGAFTQEFGNSHIGGAR